MKGVVPYTRGLFLGVGALTLVPSALILYVILTRRRLHNACNAMIGQLTMLDAGFSLFVLAWFPTKMYLGIERCQMEGTVMFACNVGWMYSALMIAILRHRVSVERVPLDSVEGKGLIRTQALSVLAACLVGGLIGICGKFRSMPSRAYCYLLYSRYDVATAYLYGAVLVLISLPTLAAVCLYWAISENYRLLLRGQSRGQHLIVAFKSVSYASLFFLTFLPYGCGMLAELVAGTPRSPLLDAALVTFVLIHKLASPLLTLLLHAPIAHEVACLFRPT